MSNQRYICIHGHFYQPPRENPLLEAIEQQDSAYPYHDWNERITAECYGPNATSRILDADGRIVQIINNYARISFNFGPTLLSWLEQKQPEVYRALLEADRESKKHYGGHGSAMAQVYNHMIMPLANSRDKYTQVLWGIRDFEYRFGRVPEGMWLAETAVDLEALDIMSKLGVAFTVLAPRQARRVRRIGERRWQDLNPEGVDPSMAYRIKLPSGRHMALFFYDGPISRGVAFEGLLNQGLYLANRLMSAFNQNRPWAQLVHIATDGETYGHHHRFGDMALAVALKIIREHDGIELTNYGHYLELHPPTHEIEIHENSSWSCVHGVERWRSDCGCNTGGHPGWNQSWRGPLRDALDWLRAEVAEPYTERLGRYLKDAWAARDAYVNVLLDRDPENVERFLARHASVRLSREDKAIVLKGLELQRHAMLMYTSCGWFFDELSGIETVQVLHYAGRVVQLAEELFDGSPRAGFVERLERARSNLPEQGDGRRIFERWVEPTMVGLREVGAHYAITSLFTEHRERATIYCYGAEREDFHSLESGRARMIAGKARIISQITWEEIRLAFIVVHFGDHNLSGGIMTDHDEETYRRLLGEAGEAFRRADLPEVIRFLDRTFDGSTYSLKKLFRDEQRSILNRILEGTVDSAESVYTQLYEQHAPLMRYLADLGIPLPNAFHTAAEFALTSHLRRLFEQDKPNEHRIRYLLNEAKQGHIALDNALLEYTLRQTIERLARSLQLIPLDLEILRRLQTAVELLPELPFSVNLTRAQNIYYDMLKSVYPSMARANKAHEERREWLEHFHAVGQGLGMKLPDLG